MRGAARRCDASSKMSVTVSTPPVEFLLSEHTIAEAMYDFASFSAR